MTNKTCGTCRFRGPEIMSPNWDSEEVDELPTGFFQCQRIHHIHRDDFLRAEPGQGGVVIDGSDYFGQLCVESSFGCVKWEPCL